MNKLLPLPALALLLAACAPGLTQQAPAATDQATYRTTCAAALDRVASRAPTLRPPAQNRLEVWLPYRVTARSADSLTVTSTNAPRDATGALGGLAFITSELSSVWTCAQSGDTATLTVASTGVPADAARAAHAALLDALNLPRA